MSGSIEISAFPPNRAVTIFWLTEHASRLTGFLIFLDPYKQSQKGRVFSNSITFNGGRGGVVVSTLDRKVSGSTMFVFPKDLCLR